METWASYDPSSDAGAGLRVLSGCAALIACNCTTASILNLADTVRDSITSNNARMSLLSMDGGMGRFSECAVLCAVCDGIRVLVYRFNSLYAAMFGPVCVPFGVPVDSR